MSTMKVSVSRHKMIRSTFPYTMNSIDIFSQLFTNITRSDGWIVKDKFKFIGNTLHYTVVTDPTKENV